MKRLSAVLALGSLVLLFYMVPNQPVLKGSNVVRARLLGLCDQLDMEHITNVQEVQIWGDKSYALGKVTFRVTRKAGGETTEEIDKFISIQALQDDGSWKIARIIRNSDNPPPE